MGLERKGAAVTRTRKVLIGLGIGVGAILLAAGIGLYIISRDEPPPDVVASLKENYFAGAEWRLPWVPFVASTHGDLARASSTAFIMSTAGPLLEPDAAARTIDEPAIFEKLEGLAWPPAPAGNGR